MTDNNRFDKLLELLGEGMQDHLSPNLKRYADKQDYKNYIDNELGGKLPDDKLQPTSFVGPEQDQEIGQFLLDVEEALRLSSKGEHSMLRRVENQLEMIKSKYDHIPDMSSRKVLDPSNNE